MSGSVIAIDIDDTIAASTESLRLLANKHANVDLPEEAYLVQGEYWGYYERVWEEHGISGSVTFEDYADEMIADQSNVPLLPSALYAIKQLAKTNRVILLTARDRSWEHATRKWIDLHFPNIDIQLYFSNAHSDASGKTKGELCKELGVATLVDDNVEHCASAEEWGIKAILFGEYGWQHHAPDEMVRCRDWSAVLEYLGNDIV